MKEYEILMSLLIKKTIIIKKTLFKTKDLNFKFVNIKYGC